MGTKIDDNTAFCWFGWQIFDSNDIIMSLPVCPNSGPIGGNRSDVISGIRFGSWNMQIVDVICECHDTYDTESFSLIRKLAKLHLQIILGSPLVTSCQISIVLLNLLAI